MKPRRTMLNPAFTELYPEVSAGLWMDACDAAMKRAERLWFHWGVSGLGIERVLCDAHFEFQGGKPRKVGQTGFYQRVTDICRARGSDRGHRPRSIPRTSRYVHPAPAQAPPC
jgi:hypothetical protein